jgi:hypothetical protein
MSGCGTHGPPRVSALENALFAAAAHCRCSSLRNRWSIIDGQTLMFNELMVNELMFGQASGR